VSRGDAAAGPISRRDIGERASIAQRNAMTIKGPSTSLLARLARRMVGRPAPARYGARHTVVCLPARP
jgi:hypothetical protein